MTLVSIVYSLYGIVLATIKKRKYSKAMMFTLVLIFLGAINDMLYSYNLLNTKLLIKYAFDGDSQSLGTSGERGFGVGLRLCKELIELHKGKLEVKSEFGLGSNFQIFIPTNENLRLLITKSKEFAKNIENNFLTTGDIVQAISLIQRVYFNSFFVDEKFSEEEVQKLRKEIFNCYGEEKEIERV